LTNGLAATLFIPTAFRPVFRKGTARERRRSCSLFYSLNPEAFLSMVFMLAVDSFTIAAALRQFIRNSPPVARRPHLFSAGAANGISMP